MHILLTDIFFISEQFILFCSLRDVEVRFERLKRHNPDSKQKKPVVPPTDNLLECVPIYFVFVFVEGFKQMRRTARVLHGAVRFNVSGNPAQEEDINIFKDSASSISPPVAQASKNTRARPTSSKPPRSGSKPPQGKYANGSKPGGASTSRKDAGSASALRNTREQESANGKHSKPANVSNKGQGPRDLHSKALHKQASGGIPKKLNHDDPASSAITQSTKNSKLGSDITRAESKRDCVNEESFIAAALGDESPLLRRHKQRLSAGQEISRSSSIESR